MFGASRKRAGLPACAAIAVRELDEALVCVAWIRAPRPVFQSHRVAARWPCLTGAFKRLHVCPPDNGDGAGNFASWRGGTGAEVATRPPQFGGASRIEIPLVKLEHVVIEDSSSVVHSLILSNT